MTDQPHTQSKNSKKKNKNKQSEAQSSQQSNALAKAGGLDGDLFSKLSQMLGDDKNIDFTNFDKTVEAVNNSIQDVKNVLTDINSGKFELIPEEEKRVPDPNNKGKLPDRDKLLLEVKKKIDIFETYSKKADTYKSEFKNPKLHEILDVLKNSIQDDISKNDELYKLIESY